MIKAEINGDVYDLTEICEIIKNAEDDVELVINSPGGSVFEGLQLVNAIQNSQHVVTAKVEVMAASIAAVITLACDSFTIGKNDLMLLHNCWTVAVGNKEELQQEIQAMQAIDTVLHNIVAEHCNNADAILESMDNGDVWLTGEEVAEMFDNCELVEKGNKEAYAASAMPSLAKLVKAQNALSAENAKLKAELEKALHPYTASAELTELLAYADELE